jgi:2-polyprenyl-3-methyl-5-hydroxy-6-metoxy-1,4-benzoquinol methylase
MEIKYNNYEYEVDASSDTVATNVVRLVGKNKRVLDIGCGSGSFTKTLAQHGCKVTGLERNPESIKKVRPYCVEAIHVDLNSCEWPSVLKGEKDFDVIVAADVLEHLYDPWKTLQQMVPLINSNGYFVISLPHIGHAAVMACLMNGNFEYQDKGLLDSTHIRFFGFNNIEELLAQAKLKIIEVWYATALPENTEFATEWGKLSPTLQDVLIRGKYAEIYQIVMKVTPVHYAGNVTQLIPPEHKHWRITDTWQKRLRRYFRL